MYSDLHDIALIFFIIATVCTATAIDFGTISNQAYPCMITTKEAIYGSSEGILKEMEILQGDDIP